MRSTAARMACDRFCASPVPRISSSSSTSDRRSVQEMLGHASIRTTEVYTRLDGDALLALHRLHHPRG